MPSPGRLVFAFVLLGLAAAPARSGGPAAFRAGLAAEDVTPEVGVPLGGNGALERRLLPFHWSGRGRYATYFKPSTGKHDPIRAKALILERGGKRLLFLSLDIVAAPVELKNDLLSSLQAMGFAPEDVLVSATHTHSGPGTLSRNWLWELIALDRFQPEVYAKVRQGVLTAVRRAAESLQPARLYAYSFRARDLQGNRRGSFGHYDPISNVLLVRSARDDAWLGGLINLAIHGTSFRAANLRFSADNMGEMERRMERALALRGAAPRPPVVLFVNGAEGDVSPNHTGEEGAFRIGREYGFQAVRAMSGMRRIEADWEVRTSTIELSAPSVDLRACGLLGGHLPLSIGLRGALPRTAELTAVRLGDMTMLAWPGEPSTALGLRLKQDALAAGATQAWVLGLTNGYLGYFVTPEEYAAGRYEACSDFFGKSAGEAIAADLAALARGLR